MTFDEAKNLELEDLVQRKSDNKLLSVEDVFVAKKRRGVGKIVILDCVEYTDKGIALHVLAHTELV
jgi:hypothetical protein